MSITFNRMLKARLQELVCFAMTALCVQEELFPLLNETFQLLANGGADFNAVAKRLIRT